LSDGETGVDGSVEGGGGGVCASTSDANPPATERAVTRANATRARDRVLSAFAFVPSSLEESLWDKDDVVRL